MSAGTDRSVQDVHERLDGFPWGRLVVAGVAAFLVGYLLTVLVVFLGPSSVSGNLIEVLVLLVFLFYSAHNVPLNVDGIGRIDWLTQTASSGTGDPAVPVLVFYAIPVLVLLAAGILAVRLLDRRVDPVRVAAAVGCLTAAYAVTAVLGSVLVRSESFVGGAARLVTERAAIFGVVYPLVFGLVGAGLAGLATIVYRRQAASAGRNSESGQ